MKDKQEEWINEFNEVFKNSQYVEYPAIKSFIKSLRAKDRDTLIEMIEKMKKDKWKDARYQTTWKNRGDGFNSALDLVKQIILEVMK